MNKKQLIEKLKLANLPEWFNGLILEELDWLKDNDKVNLSDIINEIWPSIEWYIEEAI